ncbi:MAG: hypothetical protein GKS06_03895 [Acidobacteria bacterium]|nr:hypothetical protein [Acidobacteriota bacterium]
MGSGDQLRNRFALLVLGLAVAACGGGGWVQEYPDVAQRAQTRPEAFVGPAYSQWADVEGLIGSYVLRVAKGPGRGSADLSVAVQRPANVDIRVLQPTGAVMARLSANGDEVGMAFLEDGVVYRGPASGGAFQRALGFDLTAADVVAVMVGYALSGEELAPRGVWDADARRIRVDSGAGTQAWLHPATSRFDRVLRADARGRVDARILAWWPEPPVPVGLELHVEPDGYRLELSLSGEPQLNPAFGNAFDVLVPNGFEVRSLGELAAEGGLFQRAAPADSDSD